MASKRTWWAVLAAALAFGVVGPTVADDTPAADDAAEVDGGAVNSEAVYEYLVAEMAAQRGDTEGALAVFHRLARELLADPVVERAGKVSRGQPVGPGWSQTRRPAVGTLIAVVKETSNPRC